MNEYRLVARNTLAELEQAVRALQADRWDLQREAESISLVGALDDVAALKPIAVAMIREKP